MSKRRNAGNKSDVVMCDSVCAGGADNLNCVDILNDSIIYNTFSASVKASVVAPAWGIYEHNSNQYKYST